MKKALPLIIACFFITLASHAQIEKGKTLLGGTIAYGHTSGYYKYNSVTVSPSLGKVIKQNLVLGVEANYVSTTAKYDTLNNTNSKMKAYGGGVFLRRYVPLLKNFFFYAKATASGNGSHDQQKNNGVLYNNTKMWSAMASLTPGLTYAITKKLYVESGLNGFALLSYMHSAQVYTDPNTGTSTMTSKLNSFNVSTSLGSSGGIIIGFRLLL